MAYTLKEEEEEEEEYHPSLRNEDVVTAVV
jgi:hypothetical protein